VVHSRDHGGILVHNRDEGGYGGEPRSKCTYCKISQNFDDDGAALVGKTKPK